MTISPCTARFLADIPEIRISLSDESSSLFFNLNVEYEHHLVAMCLISINMSFMRVEGCMVNQQTSLLLCTFITYPAGLTNASSCALCLFTLRCPCTNRPDFRPDSKSSGWRYPT